MPVEVTRLIELLAQQAVVDFLLSQETDVKE